MSNLAPNDYKLEIVDTQLVIFFTCPCCGEKHKQVLDPDYLLYEVFISCNHPLTAPGEKWRYLIDNPFV